MNFLFQIISPELQPEASQKHELHEIQVHSCLIRQEIFEAAFHALVLKMLFI